MLYMRVRRIFSGHTTKDILIKFLLFAFSPVLVVMIISLIGDFTTGVTTVIEPVLTLIVCTIALNFFRAVWLAQGEWFGQRMQPSIQRKVLRAVAILATAVAVITAVAFITVFTVAVLLQLV
jgi:hypothetical protein